MVLPAARTGEASTESATTESASLEAKDRRPRRVSWNIEVLLASGWRTAPLTTAAPSDGRDGRRADAPSLTWTSTWPSSDLSTFQNSGVAGPSSTPVSDLRQPLGSRYCPSGI